MAQKTPSFFRKQLFAAIGINLISLGVAAILLYSAFADNYKDNLLEVMQSQATLLGSASSSALLFEDEQAAATLIASLSQLPSTRFAQVLDLNYKALATYRNTGVEIDVVAHELPTGSMVTTDHLYLLHPIELNSETLGYILISASTDSLNAQQQRYTNIVLAVFMISGLLAYVLNWRLQRLFNRPIGNLIGFVRAVAKERRYDRRLHTERHDELGELFNGVNIMLDTIEHHRQQLESHSDNLENLIELRTEQLFQRANYDALTQLPNRHLLIDRLSHAIELAERDSSLMAIMFLDLDRFKIINDSLGHSIGDQLLVAVADKLKGVMRKTDSVCRWGGDEFVLLLENMVSEEEIIQLANRVLESLCAPMQVSGYQLHISTSIGIAMYPQHGADAMTLLKHADISMYRAKEQGPGKFCIFDQDMLNDSVQRLSLENKLRHALDKQSFHLVYQPQICAKTYKLLGMEALIRWLDEDTYISPNEFLPVAEEVGLIGELSEWVLDEACSQLHQWQEASLSPPAIAVNMPANMIVQQDIIEIVERTLHKHHLSADLLEIEITENTFITSTEQAIHNLKQLRTLGVKVAIDDFGTGYSCMSYLSNLPVDKLKIDGSFMRNLGQEQSNDGIVKAIITLGQSFDLVTVGECVENEYQLVKLKQLGCDTIQGYYFSKPLTVKDATQYLQDKQKTS